jgi:hypothetical protein
MFGLLTIEKLKKRQVITKMEIESKVKKRRLKVYTPYGN